MLKTGRIYVLSDALSSAPHAEEADAVVNDVEVLFIKFDDVMFGYEDDQFFEQIMKALGDE